MADKKEKASSKGKGKKVLIIVLALVICAVCVLMVSTIKSMKDNEKALKNPTTTEATTNPYNEDIKTSDETAYEKKAVSSTKISLNDKEYKKFEKVANSQKLGFRYDDYYLLEQELEKAYVKRGKLEYNLEVLNDKNEIDVNKLTKVALRNAIEKPSVNMTEPVSAEKTKEICQMVCDVCNNNKDKYDIKELATMLSHLRILEKRGTAAFADVSNKIDLSFNAFMLDTYAMISDQSDDVNYNNTTVFTHETMHLFQYASSFDGSNEVINKLGFCRRDEKSKGLPHPLYDSWLIEGSADMAMQDCLNADNTSLCYSKRISYINSVLTTFMFDKNFDRHLIERTSWCEDIYEMFDILGIKDKEQQLEYLKLLYSIEVCQECDSGFYEYYAKQTGENMSKDSDGNRSDERLKVVLGNRSDAEKYIVNGFYKDFAKYVRDNKNVDLETVFYLARFCELDAASHLKYANKNYYDYQKDNVFMHYELQQALFEAIANSSNMSLDDINKAYDDYKMYVLDDNGKKVANCNQNALTKEQKEYISYSETIMAYDNFVRIKTMVDYINAND